MSIRTFLIADVRGYTQYSSVRGDEAAARLAAAFAEIMREGAEAHGGEVIELRGDEALAVFSSARGALAAAVELQRVFVEEVRLRSDPPLLVGMGLDAGEAVAVDGGYRGGALNLAARLCAHAQAGVVLASPGVVHLARAVPGLRFEPGESLDLKGLDQPVTPLRVVPDDGNDPVAALAELEATGGIASEATFVALPGSLDPSTPLAGRAEAARRLRWAWRSARLSAGSLAVVTGAEGMGKTRIAAEVALYAQADGARVVHVRCREETGTLPVVLDELAGTAAPAVVIVDDLDAGSADDARAAAAHRLPGVLLIATGTEGSGRLAPLVDGAQAGCVVHLAPLGATAVEEIAASYGLGATELPVERILTESDGRPARVHRAVAEAVRELATRRLSESVSRTAAGWSELRGHEERLTQDVYDLQLARGRLRITEVGEECPYMGLASFDIGDADRFFGRERLVAELVTRLARTTLVGIVGPSGSGKSSAVRAGLVPTIAAGVLPGSASWTRVLLRPGVHPLRELDRAVFAALPDKHRAALEGAELPLRTLREVLEGDERVLVVVDQFEEAYTLCDDELERDAFVRALVEAAGEAAGRISVALAIRADYYGRCASDPELAGLLGANHVLVGPMSGDEYRRAIELPAQRVGLRIETPLVDALVADVAGEPGALPLLSTALVELWHRREGATIPMRAYLETGGVSGAVARLAEEAYATLSERQRDVARSVMLRLTGSGDSESVVRRRAPLSEFDADDADVARVLQVLTDDRLITLSEGSVEVAHEALLREWPRLREWVEEDRAGRRLREHLIVAAREWEVSGRDQAELYRGARLGSALDWTTEHTLELNELERSFLAESRSASEAQAARQRRTNRRLRGLLIGAGVLLLLALAAGGAALLARSDAQASATAATAQRLGAQALVVKDIDLSLLLARQAVQVDDSTETLANLESALVQAPEAIRFSRPLPGRLVSVGVSDDGVLVGYSNNGGEAAFADAKTGRVIRTVKADGFGFVPGGHEVGIGRGFPEIELFGLDLDSGKETPLATVRLSESTQAFSLTDDLRTYAELDETGTVAVRDVTTKRVLHRVSSPPGVTVFDIRFQFGYLVLLGAKSTDPFGGPEHFEIWSLKPWRRLATVDDPRTGVFASSLDRNARVYAVGHGDGSITLHDLVNGTSRDVAGRHNAEVQGVSFSADGRTLVSGADDKVALVWDVSSGELLDTLVGHSGRIHAPAFSPDAKTVYTAGLDGAAITWDLDGSRRLGHPFRAGDGNEVPEGEGDPAPTLAVSPDGLRVAVTQVNGRVAVSDLGAGHRVFETPSAGARTLDVAWSPDGKELVTAAAEGRISTWRASDGSRIRLFSGFPPNLPASAGLPPEATNDVFAVSYSPDGTVIAASASDGRILRWDSRTGEQIGKPLGVGKPAPGNVALDLTFSPDGSKLAAAFAEPVGDEGGVAVVWQLLDGKELYRANIDDVYGRGSAVAFSPDGRLLATGGGSGEIKLWDATTGKRDGRTMTGTAGWVISLDFDPTGRLLASSGTDGSTRLWDVRRRSPFGSPLPGLDNIWANSRFTPAGDRLVVVYWEGSGFVWRMEPEAWSQHACKVAGRTLTEREWELYLPGREYDPACEYQKP